MTSEQLFQKHQDMEDFLDFMEQHDQELIGDPGHEKYIAEICEVWNEAIAAMIEEYYDSNDY